MSEPLAKALTALGIVVSIIAGLAGGSLLTKAIFDESPLQIIRSMRSETADSSPSEPEDDPDLPDTSGSAQAGAVKPETV